MPKGYAKNGSRNSRAFTAERVARIVSHIRNGGVFRTTAATLVGLWPRTLEIWMAKGRQEITAAQTELERTGRIPSIGKFGQFVIDVLAAEAEIEAEVLGVVLKLSRSAGSEATKLEAATWYLSRLNNLRYGSGSQRADIQKPGDEEPDTIDTTAFVMDQLRKFKRALDIAEERGGGTST